MRINPTKLNWTAPTTNTDGSLIIEALNYTLGVSDGATFIEVISFPGSLNPGGEYEVTIQDTALTDGTHTIALAAFVVSAPDIKSDWSNAIDILLVGVPASPLGLVAS